MQFGGYHFLWIITKGFQNKCKVFILLFGPSSWEVKLCFHTKSNKEVSMLEFLGGSEVARFSFFVFLDMKIFSFNNFFVQLVLFFLPNFCVVHHWRWSFVFQQGLVKLCFAKTKCVFQQGLAKVCFVSIFCVFLC